jgi:uncharacterized membrane protein (DUF373 family)
MRDYLDDFRKIAIYSVVVLILFIIILTIIGLIISVFNLLFVEPLHIEDRQELLTFLGDILFVVIAVELLDTLLLYIRKHKLFPELILLVVLTAVAREVLVTDIAHSDPILLFGLSAILIAVAISYFLVAKVSLRKNFEREGAEKNIGRNKNG